MIESFPKEKLSGSVPITSPIVSDLDSDNFEDYEDEEEYEPNNQVGFAIKLLVPVTILVLVMKQMLIN